MKVLITGGDGFLGRAIIQELAEHDIIQLSRTSGLLIDLTKDIFNLPSAELIIHAAGKAHSIPNNQYEKDLFFQVNLQGTINLLNNLERSEALPKTFVFISSVSVYGIDCGTNINEEFPLLAKDPYGQSKIQAENVIVAWCKRHQVICTILRLPLLIGKNPKGNLMAMVNGIKRGYYFNIAGGDAKKSMVLATDVAKILLHVSLLGGVYNLTDGYHPSFKELSLQIAKKLNKNSVPNLPIFVCKILAYVGDITCDLFPINTMKLNKITSTLIFDDTKARNKFEWKPQSVLENIDF